MNTCYNPFSLAGKTVLVTGASSGIGRATAIECSKMGAKVILSARNIERLNETLSKLSGEGHTIIEADMTDVEQRKTLAKNTPELDGVVFCAGRGHMALTKFANIDKFQEIFKINFFSQAELFRLLLKGKKIKRGTSCVFIVSIGGISVFELGNTIYGCSKAALDSYVKFTAKEIGPQGIRINGVLPGMVHTPLIHKGTFTDEELEKDMQLYPLRRYGEPEEVAYGVIYLLSDAAKWITGSNLMIDGGRSIF